MGAAIDALLNDEKKRNQQQSSPSADGGISYVNTSQQGSNIAALLKATKQPNYKPPQDAYTQPIKQQPSIQPQQPKKQPNIFDNIKNTIGGAVSNGISSVENFLNPTPQKTQSPPINNSVSSLMQNTQIPQDAKKKLEPNYLSFPSLFDNPDKVQPNSATLKNIGSKPALAQAINPIGTAVTAVKDFVQYNPQMQSTIQTASSLATNFLKEFTKTNESNAEIGRGELQGFNDMLTSFLPQLHKIIDTAIAPSPQETKNTLLSPEEKQAINTIGNMYAQVLSFAGGEGAIAKGLEGVGLAKKLGVFAKPIASSIAFLGLGQTSFNSSNITKRIEKALVDAPTGFLQHFIPAGNTVVTKGLSSVTKVGLFPAQSFVDTLIEGGTKKDALEAAKGAAIIGSIFHVMSAAIGSLHTATTDSTSAAEIPAYSPQDLRDVVASGNMQGTKMGDALQNLATMADEKGKNIQINLDALQKSSIENKLDLNNPKGIDFQAKLVDAGNPEENPNTTSLSENSANSQSLEANNNQQPIAGESGGVTSGQQKIDESQIKNPINEGSTQEEKAKQLQGLTEENKPVVQDLMQRIDNALGTESKDNVKLPENIVAKANRPEILEKKPWFNVEHIRDSYRFKTVLNDISDVKTIGDELKKSGIQIVKTDTTKMLQPKEWGFRFAAFDLKMPNGQLVEYYAPVKEIEAAKNNGGHQLFENWRNTTEEYRQEHWQEYQKDLLKSRELYQTAWDNYLSRAGLDDKAATASWNNTEASLGETGSNDSANSLADNGATLRQPLASRNAAPMGEPSTNILPSDVSRSTIGDNGDINKNPSNKSVTESNERVNDSYNMVMDALSSGDIEGAKALKENFEKEDNITLPSIDDMQQAVADAHQKVIATVQKEIEAMRTDNPDDPTNKLLTIAQKMHSNVSRLTLKRTVTSPDGALHLGGKAVEVYDRLVNATDIDGFAKNIKILHATLNSEFSNIHDIIQSGGIDGADYEQFKQQLNGYANQIRKYNSARLGIADKNGIGQEQPKTTENSNQTFSTPEIGEPAANQRSSSVQLNSGLDPGLDKFFNEDLKPAFKTLGAAGKEAYDVVNPPKATAAAQEAANTVRKARAAIDNYQSIVGSKYTDYRKFFRNFSDEQNIKNISNYERTGQFAVEPKVKQGETSYSQLYHDSMVESYKVLRAAYGKDTEGFIENYVRRAFVFDSPDEEAKGTAVLTNFMRSLSANKSPLKQRVLDMPLDEAFQDMKDRDIKVKMASANPEELRQWSLVNAKKALEYNAAWKDLKQNELIQFVRKGTNTPDGMVKLDDRAAQVFAPAEVHYPNGTDETGKLTYSDKGYETTLQNGSYYADPSVARILNNVISRGYESSNLYKAMRVTENSLNQLNLGLSAFHLTGTAINAGISDVALGMRNVLQGKPIEGAGRIVKGLTPGASFVTDLYKGQSLISKLMTDDPVAKEVLDTIVNPAGGRIAQDKRYDNDMVSSMRHAFANGNVPGGVIRIPHAFLEATLHPLMNYAIPRVKLGAFLDLAENIHNRLPVDATDEDRRIALNTAWNSIDNRFGQLVYDNLFWNKVHKDIALLATRSVGWNLGTIRELGGGIGVDTIRTTLLGKGKVNTPLHERITDRTLYSAALILGVATMGGVYQYLHTGQGPQELKDYFFPKNGGVDKNGNATRTSLPTYVKDLYAYTSNLPDSAVQTVLHKSSPLIDIASSLIQNKDYYGNLIRNPTDPVGTQMGQLGSYLLGAATPFSLQQLNQQRQGKATPEQMAESFFGFVKAPSQVIESDQQKAAQAAYEKVHGLPAPKTPEEVQAARLKAQAYQEVQQNGWRNSPALKELIKNGTIKTHRQLDEFVKNSYLTPNQRLIHGLPKAQRQQYLQK